MRSSKTEAKAESEHREWHALSVQAVLEILGTSLNGITEAAAKERLEQYGKNIFSEEHADTVLTRLLGQFKSPLTVVLALAFVVTLLLQEYVDAFVILFALLIAVILGIVQEGKASRAFQKLAHSQVKTAQVTRSGKRHEILAEDLVPGDIVTMQGGMQIPADLRIVEAKNFSINEASLTGEWLGSSKHTERVPVGTPFAELSSMAHLGTFVAEGYGMGVVVATGDDTAMGQLAGDLSAIKDEETPVQWEMRRLSRIMLIAVLILIAAIFMLGMARGEEIGTMLLTSIAIAVAAIPEGLPAAVTIILAVGMETLLKRGGLVRNLLAAETLGSTTYILTDKTGTLTKARMAVTDMYHDSCVRRDEGPCDIVNDAQARTIIDLALCASDAFLDENQNGDSTYTVRGEPMERAILELAQDLGIPLQGESARALRTDYLAFESKHRFAAGLTTHGNKKRLCINGAPELLLENATKVLTPDGAFELSPDKRNAFFSAIERYSKDGKRLIAVAFKDVTYNDIPDEIGGLLGNITFGGLLIITDPIRKDVKEAIKCVERAGVAIRLVTGDNPQTALSIAREVGIAREHDVAILGDEMKEYSDGELLEVIRTTRVFARVLPRQKMRLAQVLQMHGEIVAMTGDGINDAAALRKAHIGVALGSGTEVAKESSDLVLVNDSFATIGAAIEEGRRIIANLRKIVGYLLATSASEAVLIGGALISGGALPILPAQILWANIIEEGLMSVAFAFEPGDKNAMEKRPRDIHAEGIFSRNIALFSGLVITVLGILLLSIYGYLRYTDVPLEELRSVMFLAISLDSLFIAFSFRSLTVPVWKIPFKTNLFFMGSFLVSLVLFMIILTVPFFQYVFSYQPVSVFDIILVVAYGFFSMMIIEVGKWFFFERGK